MATIIGIDHHINENDRNLDFAGTKTIDGNSTDNFPFRSAKEIFRFHSHGTGTGSC